MIRSGPVSHQNVTVALHALSREGGRVGLWVDCFSINQADEEEKGSQVAMMASI